MRKGQYKILEINYENCRGQNKEIDKQLDRYNNGEITYKELNESFKSDIHLQIAFMITPTKRYKKIYGERKYIDIYKKYYDFFYKHGLTYEQLTENSKYPDSTKAINKLYNLYSI